jgi:hypothetical protein
MLDDFYIVAKSSWFHKLEAKTFMEAMSASIAGKWIDEDSRHTRVGKTMDECQIELLPILAYVPQSQIWCLLTSG